VSRAADGLPDPQRRARRIVRQLEAAMTREASDTDTMAAQRPGRPGSVVASPRRAPASETLRLYKADWRAFEAWCAERDVAALPASAATVAAFLTAGATLSAGALARRTAAIAAQHRQARFVSPTDDPGVSALLRAARHGATPRRAPPPSTSLLLRMAATCPGDRAGLRDRALLLLAAAGLGRATLVGLDAEDIAFTQIAADLAVRQLDAVRRVTIPRGANPSLCPVQALQDWFETSDTLFGPVFRKIDRWGNIEQTRLGTDAIRRILARRRLRKPQRVGKGLT
jgi:hypothetical protein